MSSSVGQGSLWFHIQHSNRKENGACIHLNPSQLWELWHSQKWVFQNQQWYYYKHTIKASSQWEETKRPATEGGKIWKAVILIAVLFLPTHGPCRLLLNPQTVTEGQAKGGLRKISYFHRRHWDRSGEGLYQAQPARECGAFLINGNLVSACQGNLFHAVNFNHFVSLQA